MNIVLETKKLSLGYLNLISVESLNLLIQGKCSVKADFPHYIYPITFAAKYNQIKIVVKWKHQKRQRIRVLAGCL